MKMLSLTVETMSPRKELSVIREWSRMAALVMTIMTAVLC